ncbi:MAG: hypothetical protein NVS3B7_13050 [Candidatus Elarobacter sp.]
MFAMLRVRCAALVAAFVIAAPSLAGAHPGHDDAPAAQNSALLSAVVALGGGADHFSGAAFRRALSAPAAGEEQALRTSVGSPVVDRFDEVFGYVVLDGVATMKRSGKALPIPSSVDAKTVAAALYAAGLREGTFDIERLFDTLFSPAVHNHAMIAVGRKYGASGETAYHVVLARLVQDLGKS